jgi:hypothetical protein
MKTLPVPARIFVSLVIAVGAILLAYYMPYRSEAPLGTFVVLLALSSITSIFKVSLPLARSGSTMSVSYAVDFAALLLLGPNETMLVAAVSAWSQCTFRIKERNPLPPHALQHGLPRDHGAGGRPRLHLAGRRAGGVRPSGRSPKPLVGAATTYFVINTAMVATAIALSTRQPC